VANTMLQVSLNPLLQNVVQGERLTSSLTTGQFIKALSSLSSQPLAALCVSMFGRWELIFPVYAAVTVISTLWLMSVRLPGRGDRGARGATSEPVEPSTHSEPFAPARATSFGEVFGLLGDGRIAMLFLGIIFVVGIDVGINIAAPELLKERTGATADFAGYGSMVYFVFRALGAFLGAFVLARRSSIGFFRRTIVVAAAAIAMLFFARSAAVLFVLYAVIGLAIANVFAIVFGHALSRRPDKANEISALMITGVAGGAVISIVSGPLSDAAGSQVGALAVVGVCVLYLVYCSFRVSDR